MTYDELRAALNSYMKRSDPETVANEPTALELARLVVAKTFFPLESETLAAPPLVVVAGVAPLPADFGRAVAVGRDLAYTAPREWQRLVMEAPKNLGGKYSIFAGMVHVDASLSALSLVYNRQPEPIAASESNWLSEFYAPIWLHAARAEQYRFIEDMESADQAETLWRGQASQLSDASEQTRQAGGSLRMKGR